MHLHVSTWVPTVGIWITANGSAPFSQCGEHPNAEDPLAPAPSGRDGLRTPVFLHIQYLPTYLALIPVQQHGLSTFACVRKRAGQYLKKGML